MASLRRITFLSFLEGAFCSLMVVFGETIAVTYIASQEQSAVTLGLLATLPAAIGAIFQALIPFLLKRTTAPKLAFAAITTQMVGLVGIGLSFLKTPLDPLLLGLFLTFYWIGGFAAGAPWQDWVSRIVPVAEHNRFFARRSSFLGFILLICYLFVGLFLNDRLTNTWVASLVLISVFFRSVSFVTLYLHPRPLPEPDAYESTAPKEGLHLSLGVLCLLSFLFKTGVCLSSPFYAPFMLQKLHMSTFIYFFLNSVPLMVRTLFIGNWGKLLDDKRIYEGFVICMLGISLLPTLWVINNETPYLALWQLLSGLVWSGYELISLLYIQQLYPKSILRSMAFFMSAGSLGNALGAYLGGLLQDNGMSYEHLFNLSAVLRIVTGIAFVVYLRQRSAFRFRHLNFRASFATVLSVRPSLGVMMRVIPLNRSIRPDKLLGNDFRNSGRHGGWRKAKPWK